MSAEERATDIRKRLAQDMVSAVNEESPESLAQCAGTLLICLNEAMFYIEHLLVEIEETTNEE